MPMRRAAFTVVELLVVIAIIAILTVLVTVSYRHIIESGRATACLSNLHVLGTGLNAYLGEHELTMPKLVIARKSVDEKADAIDTVLLPYLSNNRAVFACPSDRQKHFAETTGTSYLWDSALNEQRLSQLNILNLTDEHALIPVMSDKEGFHPYLPDNINVLYADGHVSTKLQFK
jgi:prepilin-type N-terminal cleavage/methylation domain-containing protein/prepilin-type processing-associated H-X9-DG protein